MQGKQIPKHVAIIMDGNNRWAKANGKIGLAGHKRGAERVRDIVQASMDAGVEALTIYAFSSENWQRPAAEVAGLMKLFKTYVANESKALLKKGGRMRIIGARDKFSKDLLKAIDKAEELTKDGSFTLNIAVDYGGRWDIVNAAKQLATQVSQSEISVDQIDEDLFNKYCQLGDQSPPDLLIRTGGDYRISNYLLWQCAYAEFYFTDIFWPDFDEHELDKAIDVFSGRQRRFGKTAEQVEAEASETS